MWMFAPKFSQHTRADGKTVIITGGNTGIGRETVRELYRRGAHVIMAVRSTTRGEEAREDVLKSPGKASGPFGSIVVEQLDLGSLRSVRSFAARLAVDKVDVLLNNAGVLCGPRRLTIDGFESQMGINHLGHFLLTLLLLDKLKAAAPARVVNVSSAAHFGYQLDLDDLQSERSYEPWTVYCQTKLANILFSRELARRLRGSGISVYSLHPGVVNTEIARSLPWRRYIAVRITAVFYFRSAMQGAQTSLFCALEPSIQEQTGLYYDDCKEVPASEEACSDEDAARLWDISCRLVGLQQGVEI